MSIIKGFAEFLFKFVITAVIIAIMNRIGDGFWSFPKEQSILNAIFVVSTIEYFQTKYEK